MSRKRLLLLTALGWLSSFNVFAQTQLSLQSGNVDQGLLSGGNISPSSLFNGSSNITVPIYNDISLSYNTGGVQVNESAGQIGLHWNLNAGGSITRVMKDIPDEMNKNLLLSINGSNSPTDGSGLKGKFTQYGLGTIPAYDNERYADGESDDFIFSVGSLNFTFNIGQGGFIYTNPQTNIKIDLLLDGTPVTTSNQISAQLDYNYNSERISFRVRDAEGNTYYFIEGDLSQMSYGTATMPALAYNYISKWVIQKIVKSDGREINYQYTTLSNNSNYNISYVSFSSFEEDGQTFSQSTDINTTNTSSNQLLLKHSNLISITYPNKTVATFVYNTTPNTRCDEPHQNNSFLTEIQLTSAGQGVRYVLDQAYAVSLKDNTTYTPATTPPVETALGNCQQINGTSNLLDNAKYHRLILKGIHMASMDGTVTNPYYTFKYNYRSAFRLPPRFSGSQDYYGFYNGKLVSQNDGMLTIPLHTARYGTTPYATYGVDRSDDAYYAVADILDTVENAYGGAMAYFYEGHQLSNVLSDANITLPTDPFYLGVNANDGVRLKAIISFDPHYPNKYQKQSFIYSGGQRFTPGGYFDFVYFTEDVNAGLPKNVFFNESFISPHQFINGSNHGYSSVSSVVTNESGQQLSRKDITFQNISRGLNNTSYYYLGTRRYFEAPWTDKQYIKDWEIGLPLTTTEYDQNNNIISVTTNTYTTVEDMNSTAGKISNTKTLSTEENGQMLPSVTEDYRPYSGMSLLTQTAVQKYITSSSYTSDVISYSYDAHNNLSATVTQNSRGETFTLKNIYNYNVSGPNVQYGSTPGTLYNMTSDGLEIKVGMERWKSGTSSTLGDKLMDASISRFQYQSGKLWIQKLYTLQSLSPITFPTYTGISTLPINANQYSNIINAYNLSYTQPLPNFQTTSEVTQFDSWGNPTETQLLGQNSYVASIYDPIAGTKIAEVTNARVADVAATGFEPLTGVQYTGSETTTNGGFTYNQWGVTGNNSPVSGAFCFKLITGPTANTYINSPVLTAGKSYTLTFWVKTNPSGSFLPKITDAGNVNIAYVQLYTTPGGWANYKATFIPSVTGIAKFTTTFAETDIDEIRLFPTGAEMKNWFTTPFFGVISSTDPSGRISYIEYDDLGRPVITRDQEGNITSKKDYRIQ